MLNQLAEVTTANFLEQYGLLILLVVFLIGIFIFNSFRSKKYQEQEKELHERIKIGTKIKTYSGIYGTVVGMRDTPDARVVKLSLDGKATLEIDFKAIYLIEEQQPEIKELPAETTAQIPEGKKEEPKVEADVKNKEVKKSPVKKAPVKKPAQSQKKVDNK